jgi:uncharacterized protein with HEPN domain
MTKDIIRLKHIINSIDKIFEYLLDKDYSAIDNESILQDAVARQFSIMGEAANNLSLEFRKSYPEIPWRDIADMRNKIIHEYFEVDNEILWKTYKDDLPNLKEQLIKILLNN